MTSAPSKPTLLLIGVPLDDNAPLPEPSRVALAAAKIVVGESRKVTFRYVKEAGGAPPPEVFLLDPPRKEETEAMEEALVALKKEGGTAALLSDTGMPVLFDPGAEVLEFCRRQGFAVRTVPTATSWATAAAASGFAPPFYVPGFPPRDEAERRAWWAELRAIPAHAVILETPYRFRLLLKQLHETYGPSRRIFLAWEISKPAELLFWGTTAETEKFAGQHGLEKGEFIVIVESPKGKRR